MGPQKNTRSFYRKSGAAGCRGQGRHATRRSRRTGMESVGIQELKLKKHSIMRISICLILFFLFSCSAQKRTGGTVKLPAAVIARNFNDAGEQYKVMMKNLPPGRFPKTYDSASHTLQTSGSDWWC